MARLKKKPRQSKYVMTRLNDAERSRLEQIRAQTGLSLQEFGRCRLLYIPFEAVSGQEPAAIPPLSQPQPVRKGKASPTAV